MSDAAYPVVRVGPLRLALPASINSQSWTTLEATATEPVGDGIFPIGLDAFYAPHRIKLVPIGNGNPGDTFAVRVYGWQKISTDPTTQVWWPFPLVELACVLCAMPAPKFTGVPARLTQETDKVCDTITVANGSLGPAGELVAWGNNMAAWALCETRGPQKLQFDFQADSNQYVNAMWCTV